METPNIITELELHYNVKFTNAFTGSFYCKIKGIPIRISNHPSMYSEKMCNLYDKVLDLPTSETFNSIVMKIEGVDPFSNIEPGTKIHHKNLGDMILLEYNVSNQSVTVDGGKVYHASAFEF